TSTGYAKSDITVTDIPVVINKHKAVTVELNVENMGSTNRDLLDEQALPMAYALGEDMVGALYALITAGNYANSTAQAESGFARPTVIKLGKELTKPKAPRFKRSLLLNADYYAKLAEDATVVAVLNNPDAARSISTGKLPD